MKYCVIKDTTKIIDGSDNPFEIMLQNAVYAGFSESEVEVLTEEGYQARKANEPVHPKEATEIELLQQENADLWFQSMTNESRIESAETEVANLWYEVMMG